MSEQRWIIMRNWGKFQHSDVSRTESAPIWIRNYTRLLHSEDYLSLTWQQRGVLHGLWLEYAASDGQLPDNTATISRRLGDRVLRATLDALNHAGYIEFSASKPPKLSASLEQIRTDKKNPPTPLAAQNGKPRTPSPKEAPSMINVVDACQHFIEGRAWDDTFDEQMIREEFGRIERGRRTEGTIGNALPGLLEQWKATRQDRYGIKADLTA